jgi:hypothetical protein
MSVDEWDSWLRGDGTTEVLTSLESQRQSTGSSLYESESCGLDLNRNTESTIYEDILAYDAPFELDEPCTSLPFPFQPFPQKDDTRWKPKSRGQPKQGHNAIEKRYRMNLNNKIAVLRQSIPSLRSVPNGLTEGDEGAGSVPVYKYGKAAILTGAIEYISQLESSTKHLGIETAARKARVEAFEAFEKLATSGSIFSGKGICSSTSVSNPLKRYPNWSASLWSKHSC